MIEEIDFTIFFLVTVYLLGFLWLWYFAKDFVSNFHQFTIMYTLLYLFIEETMICCHLKINVKKLNFHTMCKNDKSNPIIEEIFRQISSLVK